MVYIVGAHVGYNNNIIPPHTLDAMVTSQV